MHSIFMWRRQPMVRLAVFSALMLGCLASSCQAGIVVTDVLTYTGIWKDQTQSWLYPTVESSLSSPTNGASIVATASLPNETNIATTTVQYTQVGSQLIVDVLFEQAISGRENSEGYAYVYVVVEADQNLRYGISGNYAVNGPGAPYLAIGLEAINTLGPGVAYPFQLVRESRSTANDAFSVTGPHLGDFDNYLSGSPSGTISLFDGHPIQVVAAALVYVHSYADSDPSSATGSLRFVFEPDSAAVPEPTSMIAMGVGLAGLAMSFRRRR
jgi:hypothetical protein